jgi:type I restriction enzyme S subunit
MEEWKEYRLGDFMEFNPKISLKKDTVARKITMDLLVPHSRDIYSWTYEPYSGGAKFQNGDTIMARITPCLENGKHAFISLLDENEIAYGSTEYIVIRGRKGISDNLFVYYLTHFPSFKDAAVKSMVGTSGRQRAQVDVLENLTMKLPSLHEQKRIANILTRLDDKIAVNKQINDNFVIEGFFEVLLIWMLITHINDNLEQQAQALFKSWFVDFEPFHYQTFVESELGMIPKGFKIVSIGEMPLTVTDYVANGSFASLKENVKLYEDENYAYFIRNTDLKSKDFCVYVDEHSYNFLSKSKLEGGEIIISNVGDVGSVHLCPYLDKPMTLGNNIIMVKPYDEFYRNFLYILFKWNYGQDLIQSIKGGSAQPKFNKTDFKSLKIIVPNEAVLKEFDEIVSSTFKYIAKNDEENKEVTTLRDTLLPRLMSGEFNFIKTNM